MNQETSNKVSNSEYDSLISKSLKNSSAKEKSITVGKVVSIEVDDAQPVEFGQTIIVIN